MTICRYFLQGTCRYGSRCRYEHLYPNQHSYGEGYSGGGNSYGGYRGSSGGYSGSYGYGETYGSNGNGGSERGGMSILRAKAVAAQFPQGNSIFDQSSSNVQPRSVFGQPPASSQSRGIFGHSPASTQAGGFEQNTNIQSTSQPPSGGFFVSNVSNQKQLNPQESKEVHQMIINEFTIWERSGQWPLSCVSLFREQGCFPGLVDYSPEEIRWLMYHSQLMGNFDECQLFIKELYNKSKLVKEQYMTPNAQVLDLLSKLAKGEKIETPASSPLFPPDKFNVTTNVFGQSSGGISTTPVGAPTVSPSSFSFILPNVQTSNANQNFGEFGTLPMNVLSSPVFGSNATSSLGPSIFGGAQQTPNTPLVGSSSPRNGLFGSSANTSLSINDSVTYTPMSELSEEIINAFNAPVFSMGSVPIKPPPKELCGLKR